MIGIKRDIKKMAIFPMLKKFKETFWPSGSPDKYPFEKQSVTINGQQLVLKKAELSDSNDYMNIQEIIYSKPAPWPQDVVDTELRNKNALYLSLIRKNHCVAFIGVSLRDIKEAHITNIAVLPELQKDGIGHLFLNQIFEYCRKQNFQKISLEVDVTNESAIELYKAFGFKTRTIHEKYYFRNHHDALEMVVDL